MFDHRTLHRFLTLLFVCFTITRQPQCLPVSLSLVIDGHIFTPPAVLRLVHCLLPVHVCLDVVMTSVALIVSHIRSDFFLGVLLAFFCDARISQGRML